MAILGIFGLTPPLIFGATPIGANVFQDFEKELKIRFVEHEIHLGQSIIEYTGINAVEIKFKMIFTQSFTTPADMGILILETMAQQAQPQPLIIGAIPVASGLSTFVITNLKNAVRYWDGAGGIIACTVDVTLKQAGGVSIGGFQLL
jgi:hypothetical protein